MRYEWIIGGVLLLACALPVKILWDQLALQRLALAVNVLWAVLAAFHLWPFFQNRVAGLLAGTESIPLDALSFWIAFALMALPGWAVVHWGLRDSSADLPIFFERGSGIVLTTVVSLLLPCLVIMTVWVMPIRVEHLLPAEGVPGRCISIMRNAPVQLYLRTAALVESAAEVRLRKERLPLRLRTEVQPRG